ncbi:uncharacterized protein ASPGLDRAFT_748952 [Aspergillus glaucus CBS 516.65]|uniref:Uncharacterized protein n=1 Tax=Aspergillus glaucus CBS 516.65 TaxID=1160497 RepID=A0A1L9VY36_ASPGL|nr:hypothetical protein ASPGLDRAFT_748952 [Aspergillus glaucus CBS 516.65]OJJ88838.1 hypothetical protein ASPGLDRAFT_748952 [Aspergillus glaucus CBS 516.65]
MSSVNCIGIVYGSVRCAPHGPEYMQCTPFSLHTNDIKPSTRVHCNPKRPPKDFLHGPPVVSPIFSNPEASGSWTLASGQITTDNLGTPLSYLPETPPTPTRHHSITSLQVHNISFRDWSYFVRSRRFQPVYFVAIARGFIRCVSLTCLAMSGTAAVDDSSGLSCEHTLAWK